MHRNLAYIFRLKSFTFATVLVLSWVLPGNLANVRGQQISSGTKAELCEEKRVGLENFERAAPEIREETREQKKLLENVLKLTPQQIDDALAEVSQRVELYKNKSLTDTSSQLDLKIYREYLDLFTTLKNKEFFDEKDISESRVYQNLVNEVNELESQQTT